MYWNVAAVMHYISRLAEHWDYILLLFFAI